MSDRTTPVLHIERQLKGDCRRIDCEPLRDRSVGSSRSDLTNLELSTCWTLASLTVLTRLTR